MDKKIGREEVRYIAHLSRLKLADEEEEKFARQLGEILAYVDKLRELDTRDVLPTSHVLPIKNVFREDKRRSSLSQDEALSNAPRKKYGHFQVPRVIE